MPLDSIEVSERCCLCLKEIEDIEEHMKEHHPDNPVYMRFRVWKAQQPRCQDCLHVIPFKKTWTDTSGAMLAPCFCEECEESLGLLMLMVRKLDDSVISEEE